jgi:hypothetical protein
MQALELSGSRLAAALLAGLGGAAAAAAGEEVPLLRHRAPITVEQGAAFVRLPLTVEAYAKSAQPSLADLRVIDSRGERVPFALLAPRPDEVATSETWRHAALYPLPPKPAAGGQWASPVDVTVEGGRITVRQRGGATAPRERSPGWLVDLGERSKDDPRPQTLRLQWSGPAEFTAPYSLEHSAELKQWRGAGSGQLLALASAGGTLTQPDIALPADIQRFVRIVWSGPGPNPQVDGARAATAGKRSINVDAPVEFTVAASAEPPGAHALDAARRSLHFDLGAVVPLTRLDLQLGAATLVLPVHVQVRERADWPWQSAGGTVYYRIDRGSEVARSPAFAVQQSARYVRLVPDERAAVPAAGGVKLVAQAQLASLVFAAQGEPPFALLAGDAKASAGALPLATLVPELDKERPRFGRATLGVWSEVREAAEKAKAEERRAALRPWLLWAVLIAGVAGLGLMVWRLARGISASRPVP